MPPPQNPSPTRGPGVLADTLPGLLTYCSRKQQEEGSRQHAPPPPCSSPPGCAGPRGDPTGDMANFGYAYKLTVTLRGAQQKWHSPVLKPAEYKPESKEGAGTQPSTGGRCMRGGGLRWQHSSDALQ